MIKKLTLLFLLCSGAAVQAQDLDISLFDDAPILGRAAAPLDSLRLTPPPAPDIRIDLDNSQDQVTAPTPPSQPLPTLPSTHIDLSGTTPAPVAAQPNTAPAFSGPLHNVSLFDIGGFNLSSPAYDVLRQARENGFRVTITQESIPLFYSTDYAYKCRQKGLVIPDQITQCIKDYACHEKTRYISEATLTRKNEVYYLYFTSNATENQLYKIIYINKGDNSLNFTRINKARKELRQKEFWAAIFDKYGYPDDANQYIWGDPNKAYMKVFMHGSNYDGYIIIEDVKLSNEDYFEAEDVEKDRPMRNHFSF
ncbi:MAG: hypothetical protein II938_03000 [Alphaproteobacteria bacterium]|nr:hypothetical protein [Alphaproteobacteria bacterium]